MEGDDPHGLVDSFLYGVSLNRVAHPVAGADNLFVMPSGTEPMLTEEIFRSDRWRRLAGGFREVGALLLLVAPADAPGLDALVAMLDGVVTVGDVDGRLAARFPVLGAIEGRRPTPPTTEIAAIAAAVPPPAPRPRPTAKAAPVAAEPANRGVPDWFLPALVLTIAVAAAGAWLVRQQAASRERVARTVAASRPRPARPAPAVDTQPGMNLVPINTADSATAAAYAIEVAKINTEDGARQAGEQTARVLPVASAFPVLLGSDRALWYRVVGGAWRTRAQADSALAGYRAARPEYATASVLRAPLALLVARGLAPDSARARAAAYAARGIPAYVLRQDDGTDNLYAGAFETPDQSTLLAAALMQGGDVPTLVYRTGRP